MNWDKVTSVIERLKHEWKTFAVGVISATVFGYDALIANGIDFTPIIPEQYRAQAGFAVACLMLFLRRYL